MDAGLRVPMQRENGIAEPEIADMSADFAGVQQSGDDDRFLGARDLPRAYNRCTGQRFTSENGIVIYKGGDVGPREAGKGEELHRELSSAPKDDAIGIRELAG